MLPAEAAGAAPAAGGVLLPAVPAGPAPLTTGAKLWSAGAKMAGPMVDMGLKMAAPRTAAPMPAPPGLRPPMGPMTPISARAQPISRRQVAGLGGGLYLR